jgi:plasmid stability protein
MPTLYVENVPDALYKALRKQARLKRRSIAAEVIELIQDGVVTDEELKRRHRIAAELKKIRLSPSPRKGPFPSAEEMIREDRER